MYIHSLIKTEYTVIFKFKNVSTTVFLNFKTFTTILDIYDIYDIYIYIYYIHANLPGNAIAKKRFQHSLLANKPATMTQSAQTINKSIYLPIYLYYIYSCSSYIIYTDIYIYICIYILYILYIIHITNFMPKRIFCAKTNEQCTLVYRYISFNIVS